MKIDVLGLGNQEAYSEQCPNVTLLPTNLFDYSKLRLRKQTVQADLQDHTDFDNARVTRANPRLYDITTSQPRPRFSGISISWTLPQMYRWELASEKQDEFSVADTPPNRWMVARVTRNAATNAGWVFESDACRHIDDIDPSVDLMTDVSQYIRAPEKLADERIVDLQGEYFLGEQRNLEDWAKGTDSSTIVRVKPLKANSAGNILFADYQPHNPNVFSFHDPLDDIPAVKFKKFNVIDKFGRGVEVVTGDSLMPTITSVYRPSSHMVNGKETPNVVVSTGDKCEYFQIPPSINQPARLFDAYLKPGEIGQSTGGLAASGKIRFVFTSAGDFRGEILTSEGDAAARVAQLKQPPISQDSFAPPLTDNADQWKINTFDDFIQNLKTKRYALRMIEILGDASSCMAPPAESYSSVINAAFGRPFALAIAGWSIELNHEELQPQTSLQNLAGKSYSKLSDYDLPLHLGLKEYSDDGLAAYIPLREDAPRQPDFGKTFTFWPSGVAETDLNEDFACNPIHPSNLPTLKARHVDLFENGRVLEVDDTIKGRQEQILPFCLLVDVFHPVKAQTGVLPPSSLALPDWAVQQALRKIRLCYRAGPFLFREDPLKSLKAAGAEDPPAPPTAGVRVHVPVVPYGKWSWLQPYIMDGNTKYWSQDVDKAEAKGDVPEVRKYPFTMADGIMMSTESLLHEA